MAVYTFFSQAGGGALQSDNGKYAMGMQFTVSNNCTLTGIWWNSPTGATTLPSQCAIWLMTSPGNGSIVSGTLNTTPSWSGAAGSGWVRCGYSNSVGLSPGNTYKVSVYLPGSTSAQYGATANYWSSGPGASGLTVGILSAPNNAGGDGGQDTFKVTGTFAYPTTSSGANNYWLDVEVTTPPVLPDMAQQIPPGFISPASVFFSYRRRLPGATNYQSSFNGAIAGGAGVRGLFNGPQLRNFGELPGPVVKPLEFASPDLGVPFLGYAAASGVAASATTRHDPFTGRMGVSGVMAGKKTSDSSVSGAAAATGIAIGLNLGVGGMDGPVAASGIIASSTVRVGAFTGATGVSASIFGSTPLTGGFAGVTGNSGIFYGAQPIPPLQIEVGSMRLTWQFGAPR